MSTLAKGLIITGVVLVVIVIGGIASAVYLISQQTGPLLAKSKQAMEDGRRVGATTDNNGCVSETLAGYKKEPGFTKAVTSQVFLSGCLPASRATPGFCDAVPPQTEIMKSVSWRGEQCLAAGISGDSYCSQLFGPVQQFCDLQRKTAK